MRLIGHGIVGAHVHHGAVFCEHPRHGRHGRVQCAQMLQDVNGVDQIELAMLRRVKLSDADGQR